MKHHPSDYRARIKEHRKVMASELMPNPLNFRLHPEQQKKILRGTLQDVGIVRSLLAYEDPEWGLTLIDGHLRQEELYGVEVDVEILDVTREEARVVLATIDPIGAMAGQADRIYADLLRGLDVGNVDLLEWINRIIDDVSQQQEKGEQASIETSQECSKELQELLQATHLRPKWNKNRSSMTLSIRTWDAKTKEKQIALLRSIKKNFSSGDINIVASEIWSALIQTLGVAMWEGWAVTAPPGSGNGTMGHFATEIARAIAEKTGSTFRKAFKTRNNKIKADSKHYGDRTDLELQDYQSGLWLLIDDVMTTGQTIENCKKSMSDSMVLGVAWIY